MQGLTGSTLTEPDRSHARSRLTGAGPRVTLAATAAAQRKRGEGKARPFQHIQPVTAAAGVAAARRRGPAVRRGRTAAAVRGGRRYPLVHAAAYQRRQAPSRLRTPGTVFRA